MFLFSFTELRTEILNARSDSQWLYDVNVWFSMETTFQVPVKQLSATASFLDRAVLKGFD